MKFYTLLRNNQEFGSFTYEELLAKKLKKLDLIWVEGESVVWKYPSEINELKKHVQEAEPTSGTVVNSRKEKQIVFFRRNRRQGLSFVDTVQQESAHFLPDAYLSDIPAGYEFLLGASGTELIDDNIPEEYTEKIIPENRPEEKVKHDYNYTVLGTSQVIDTREGIAGSVFFESSVDLPVSYKSKRMMPVQEAETEQPEVAKKKTRQKKKKRSVKLPVLIMIITSAFMHLRL